MKDRKGKRRKEDKMKTRNGQTYNNKEWTE